MHEIGVSNFRFVKGPKRYVCLILLIGFNGVLLDRSFCNLIRNCLLNNIIWRMIMGCCITCVCAKTNATMMCAAGTSRTYLLSSQVSLMGSGGHMCFPNVQNHSKHIQICGT
jgi:hypothetical protein